ncbi:MAG TPA: ATPase [Phycisphaerales bacterium]|nr:ATPase [Phycisphaerales bacterium]
MQNTKTILVLASQFKGVPLIEEFHKLGCLVLLLCAEKTRCEAWPTHAITEQFYMPKLNVFPDILHAVSHLARSYNIDRIIGVDDFDVEVAARLREHLRTPGMGDTTARYFRDKLAMRVLASDEGLAVPDFVHLLNDDKVNHYLSTVPGPWVLKPRSEAGAVGIKKIHTAQDLWRYSEELGDKRSYYLLERFLPGEVFHVDSIVFEGKVVFARASRYRVPPFSVWNEGGVFSTLSLPETDPLAQEMIEFNARLVHSMHLARGITHTEFIRADIDGKLYFLEMAARVGGAHLDLHVEACSGINLWREWAHLELAYLLGERYQCPEPRHDHSALLICLAREEHPDLSGFDAPEVVWRMKRAFHAGLVLNSQDPARIDELERVYRKRLQTEFLKA